MPSAGHPAAVDGMRTLSDTADVIDGSDAALVITRSAGASIQRLGTTAWVVLEALALDAVVVDGELVTGATARSIGDAVSVSKDTAANALRRLVDAGLLERRPQVRTDGRFGAGGYLLQLPAGLSTAALSMIAIPPAAPTERPGARRRSIRSSRPTRPPRPQRHDQLTLLDHPQEPQP